MGALTEQDLNFSSNDSTIIKVLIADSRYVWLNMRLEPSMACCCSLQWLWMFLDPGPSAWKASITSTLLYLHFFSSNKASQYQLSLFYYITLIHCIVKLENWSKYASCHPFMSEAISAQTNAWSSLLSWWKSEWHFLCLIKHANILQAILSV
jgi:hypothetical protein